MHSTSLTLRSLQSSTSTAKQQIVSGQSGISIMIWSFAIISFYGRHWEKQNHKNG